MPLETENIALQLIIHDWQALSIHAQPWGVWIRACESIDAAATQLDIRVPPYRVWFLDRHGLHDRTVWEWERFRIIQIAQPWCQRAFTKEPIGIFGRHHEIGLAAFARYREGIDVYLEVEWGGLFGRGWRIALDRESTITNRHTLWVV